MGRGGGATRGYLKLPICPATPAVTPRRTLYKISYYQTPFFANMLPTKPFLALALIASKLASAGEGSPCGLKMAPCAEDMVCNPRDESCTDLSRCPGTCAFKNAYPTCGGRRVEPVFCDEGFVCQDDPRIPGSCGMACDRPGICLSVSHPTCDNGVCPPGLFYYLGLPDLETGERRGVCL